MEHKWLRLYVDNVWTGREDRMVRINGQEHSIDDLAKHHGIELPDSKKTKKQVNSNEDIRYKDESGDDSDSGDGVSESTE
jgi:hypothetical protein